MRFWPGYGLTGLRLIDEQGAYVVNLHFKDAGDWVTQDVPKGKEIIGLQGIKGDTLNGGCFSRLGFILWTPNPAVK